MPAFAAAAASEQDRKEKRIFVVVRSGESAARRWGTQRTEKQHAGRWNSEKSGSPKFLDSSLSRLGNKGRIGFERKLTFRSCPEESALLSRQQ